MKQTTELYGKLDRVRTAAEAVISTGRGVIAIDGRAASGKSSLAAALAKEYKAQVVHMDDFFLQAHQRTAHRLTEVGGNVDYERFTSEVLTHILERKAFSYRPFSCKTLEFLPKVEITSPIIIVEGAYSHHPVFGKYMDLRVFLTVSSAVQTERIAQRNGAEAAEMFRSHWIPMEERYFSTNHTSEMANLVIDTTSIAE